MPPRPRFEKLEPEKREAILDAAAREFAREGEEHASLNKILADAGVSKGAAYYYFDDKKDLFATVVASVLERAVRAVGELGPAATEDEYWRELRALYVRSLEFLRKHPTLAALLTRLFAEPPQLSAPRVGAIYSAFAAWFQRVLERGQALGAVRTDLPLDLLVAVSFGLGEAFDRWTIANWKTFGKTDKGVQQVVDAGMDLFRRLLAPPERADAKTGKRGRA